MKLIILLFASLFLSCSASKQSMAPRTTIVKGVELVSFDYTITKNGEQLPTKVYLLDVSLSDRVTLAATAADDSDSSIQPNSEVMTAIAPISKQLESMQSKRQNVKVLAGVNADFFHIRSSQMVCGVMYRNGKALKSDCDSQATVFALLKDGTARCMTNQEYELFDKSLIAEAVSGRQMLLNDGKEQSREATVFHPRTAIGVTKDGKRVFILVADGRRKEYSNGLAYADMELIFKQLGAYDALNLDGGGSTSLCLPVGKGKFTPKNRPSDRAGERPVPNGLAVVEVKKRLQ